ncbi:MAG: phosphoribosyl-AMP cyclohydrolase [Deltaproteobacteria bacterium]|nr:phosphoribosyl-AMP cyclohydrolase [Deltaproteobacteria bacterium]
MSIADRVKFDDRGLAVAIAQDAVNREILMVAFMNKDALERTLQTGTVHYYSRSRNKLWMKGEESGHVQRVREIRLDCDGDAILISIDQAGVACHEGYRSCFFRRWDGTDWIVDRDRGVDPASVYGRKPS